MIYMRSEVDIDTPICRYMSYQHLLKMLDERQFFVAIRNTFDDVNECNLPITDMHIFYDAHANISPEQLKSDSDRLDKQRERQQEMGNLPTSCWTLRSTESYLMWKAYANKDGVCIRSTIRKLINCLDYDGYDAVCVKMLYGSYSRSNEYNVITKDIYYDDERELRFFFVPQNDTITIPDKYVNFPITSQSFIEEVVTSPEMSEYKSMLCVNEMMGKYHLSAHKSRLSINHSAT